jgi:sulfonate transport system permease protein
MAQQGVEDGYRAELALPSKALREPGSRRLWSRAGDVAVGLILPAVLLVVWKLVTQRQLIAPQILPEPGVVAATLVDLVRNGDLPVNIAISLGRVVGGFVMGATAGMLLGLAMGLSRRIEEYLYPTFNAFSQIPVLGLIPLLMMLVGIGEALKLVIIARACMVPVALSALQGIRGVPHAYFEVARVFRFSHAQVLRRVALPASVPAIFVGIRYGLTQGWLALVTVELLASSEGLGFLLVWGRQLFQLDVVVAAIIVVGIVGLALDKGLEGIERRLLHWRRESV